MNARIIIIVFFMLPCALFSNARIKTGMKVGMNSSQFVGKDKSSTDTSPIPGVAIGGFFVYRIHDKILIEQALYLTTKGSCMNSVGDIKQNNVFAYVQSQVLVKLRFCSEKQVYPIVSCGPALGVKTFAMNDTGMLEDIKIFDWGLVLRTGLMYKKLSWELCLDQSFVNFDKSPEKVDLKHQTLSIIFGYSF